MSAQTIVLSLTGWKAEVERHPDLEERTKSVLRRAVATWLDKRRSQARYYPQTTPDEFDRILTYEILRVKLGKHSLSPEIRMSCNKRHFCLKRET